MPTEHSDFKLPVFADGEIIDAAPLNVLVKCIEILAKKCSDLEAQMGVLRQEITSLRNEPATSGKKRVFLTNGT